MAPGGSPGLASAAEDQQPLLLEVALFLADSPDDILGLCAVSTQLRELRSGPAAGCLWRELYRARWPHFSECMIYEGASDWRTLFMETLCGRAGCILEVFHRHKKLGFAMSAMPASVSFDAKQGGYVARYLSASEVPPETIAASEEHRLRFCPEAVRPRLQPRSSPASWSGAAGACCASYPNKVLEGLDGLRAGESIELQWKMQFDSPFGWWYGQLQELEPTGDGLAKAAITFPHFSPSSQWYRLEVVFGDDQVRECEFGGYTGGVRSLDEAERRRFLAFFPAERLIL